MRGSANPYDELPYRSTPIEWTAPERLALASLLHGGPRPRLDEYRVLELGCGSGANLLSLAYYRQHARFVGVDGALSQIEMAQRRKSLLGLANLEFIHADFLTASAHLSGQFDYVIVHGVFSWVPQDVRDSLLELVARRLRQGGLLYLNYNTRPGWNVRGLVREFLLAETEFEGTLYTRAQRAQEVAAKVVAALDGIDHHYSQLIANEFRFVCEGDITWVGHEFLSPDNHPYWRSEFMSLAKRFGLEYVADADFNRTSGRVPDNIATRLDVEQITGRSIEDTIDLLCYRQLHSPILTPGPFEREMPSLAEFGELFVASCLEPTPVGKGNANATFIHPTGYEVEAKEESIRSGLFRLQPLWPRGLRVKEAIADPGLAMDDLVLLHRHGLIELRCIEPGDFKVDGDVLTRLEREWAGYFTTPYHQTWSISPGS